MMQSVKKKKLKKYFMGMAERKNQDILALKNCCTAFTILN